MQRHRSIDLVYRVRGTAGRRRAGARRRNLRPPRPRRHRTRDAGAAAAPPHRPKRNRPQFRRLAPATETIDNPYGFSALWQGGDYRRARHADHTCSSCRWARWYVIITKLIEQTRAGARRAAPSANSGTPPSIPEGAQKLGRAQRLPADGRGRTARGRARTRARSPSRIDRAVLDHHVAAALGRCDRQPHAARPGVSRDGRLDRAVRRPLRHGLGHLSRADRDRHRRPGEHRQGRGAGGRGADHDRDGPRRRGAGGARLQLDGPPQQGRDGPRAQLRGRSAGAADRRRPARGAAAARSA